MVRSKFKFMRINHLLLSLLLAAFACHKETATDIIYQNALTAFDNSWANVCDPQRCFKFDQGGYSISSYETSRDLWAYVPCGPINSKYSVTVDCAMHRADRTKWGAVGIVFNAVDNGNYKMLLISSLGDYRVSQKHEGT